MIKRLLTGLTKTRQRASIDSLGHSVKIDEQTQEHLVSGGTVLVYTAKIAQDGDTGHILAMEC